MLRTTLSSALLLLAVSASAQRLNPHTNIDWTKAANCGSSNTAYSPATNSCVSASGTVGGVWSSSTAYPAGSVVRYNGQTYLALSNNTNQNPATVTSIWTPTSSVTGGAWNSTTQYSSGSVVTFSGQTYLALAPNLNVQPDTSVDFWTDISIGGTPTSTALRVGTYTGSVVGGTGQLTGSNLSTDATGSDIGARNVTATTKVAVTGPGAGIVVTGAGATPAIPAASAGITSDTSGNLLGFEAGGPVARVCTAANGACPTGSGGTSTSTAYRVGAYTSGVSGGTGNLTGSNLTTDATGSDLGTRHLSATTAVIGNGCDHISADGALTCEELNETTGPGGGTFNLRSDRWTVTGPGRNLGPVLGTNYNHGWKLMLQHETPATMFSRGIHEGTGDGGLGWNCFAVGDCIEHYDYPFYDGGSPDPSAESFKWNAAVITESPGFFHGTVGSTSVVTGPTGYPAASKVVTINLSHTGGPNHVTDGTKLMVDPGTTGTTACSFNGNPSWWQTMGRIPITGCSGAAIPTVYAWGTINQLIGDTVQNGTNTSNIPVQQVIPYTIGNTSPNAFAAPDGTTEWKSHVCIVGQNYIEDSRLEAVGGGNLTIDVRYPNNGPITVLQGTSCAPYQAISIDAALATQGGQQATSFWSFGTLDGGATLLVANQAGGGVGNGGDFFRSGQVPWNNTSSFHLVNASEIVANLTPSPFSPIAVQPEDNGFLPANGTAVWDPHFNGVSSMAMSVIDGTSQYGGIGAQSGIGYFAYSGPRVTSSYQPFYFWNTNPTSMYRRFGGWADPPNSVIATEGYHSSFLTMSHAPDSIVTIPDVYPGTTDFDMFRLPRQSVGIHESIATYNITNSALASGTATFAYTVTSGQQPTPVAGMPVAIINSTNGGGALNGNYIIATVSGDATSGTFTVTGVSGGNLASAADSGAATTGYNYIDFAHAGANGIRTSYMSMNKNGNVSIGVDQVNPNIVTIGSTVNPGNGTVNADGTLRLHNLVTDLINGAAPGSGGGGGGSGGAEVVTFSATPTFSTATNVSRITLASNISSFTLGAGADGQSKTLCFKQGADGPDAYTVGHPANVHGFFAVGTSVNTWSCQTFTYDLTDSMWLASSLGVLNQ